MLQKLTEIHPKFAEKVEQFIKSHSDYHLADIWTTAQEYELVKLATAYLTDGEGCFAVIGCSIISGRCNVEEAYLTTCVHAQNILRIDENRKMNRKGA